MPGHFQTRSYFSVNQASTDKNQNIHEPKKPKPFTIIQIFKTELIVALKNDENPK